MAEYLGRGAYLTFGSIVLSARYTTIDTDESGDLVDKSAGSDTHDSVLAGLAKGQVSVSLNHSAGDTATWNGLAFGTEGTVTYAPEGTASGKPKYTGVGMIQSRQRKQGFNEITRLSVAIKMQETIVGASY